MTVELGIANAHSGAAPRVVGGVIFNIAFGRRNRSAAMKTSQEGPTTIDEYIATFPRDVQQVLKKIRTAIKETAPDAQEAIRYRIPTFVLNGNLVHFAAFKNHIGFYPTPSAIARFKNELSSYKGAKGSVQFPLNEPMPMPLIKKIVRFRVGEARAKAVASTVRRRPSSR